MKTIIILAAALLYLNQANSQTTKGHWLLGGNVNFSLTTYKSEAGQTNTGYVFQANPNVGYFIVDKFAIGLKAGIGREASKGTGTAIFSKFTDANFGPFVRYYLLSTENQFNILIEGAYQKGFIKGDSPRKTFKNTFSFAVGPVIYFNSTAGLEFLIGYSSSKYVGFAGSNGTIQFGLGIQFHLEK